MDEKTFAENLRDELIKYGRVSFVPLGNSMWPTIKNKRQSVVIEKKTGRLTPYDVALYIRPDGKAILHRVLSVADFGYIICGDSLFTEERVEESSVIGVLDGFFRGKKYIDARSEKEKKKSEKWFSKKGRRKFLTGCFFFFVKCGTKIKKFFTFRCFGRKKDV